MSMHKALMLRTAAVFCTAAMAVSAWGLAGLHAASGPVARVLAFVFLATAVVSLALDLMRPDRRGRQPSQHDPGEKSNA